MERRSKHHESESSRRDEQHDDEVSDVALDAFTHRERLPARPRQREIMRRRLLARFLPDREDLVLISAPAGYGKSILAAQASVQDPRPSVWCALHHSDDDPLALVCHLVDALGQIGPIDDRYLAECRRPGARGEGPLLDRLGDCMASCAPFLLVLEDADAITSGRSNAVIRRVIEELPPGCQVLVVSRSDPDIGLARLRVSGRLAEVRADELAFDRDEIDRFLDAAGVVHDGDAVAELEQRTEGWPAGVALATLSLPEPMLTVAAMRAFSGSRREVADYLLDEVLARQPPSVRTFLVETSAVRRLSGPLCDAMLGREHSDDVLQQLEHTNLFITTLDDHRQWYRYHHLFREMLGAELERADRHRAVVLLRRAAAWHEEHGAPDEAFDYARRSGDWARAGRVVLRNWERYANHGRLETLRIWLLACRDEQIESDTALAIGAGWVFLQLADAERAERYAAAAERRPDLDHPSPDGHTTLRSAMVNLRAAIGSRGARQMLEDGQFVYESEQPRRTRWLLGGCRAIGIASVLLGLTDQAVTVLEEARVLSQERESVGFARVLCLGYLALAYIDRGEWSKAAALVSETDALVETHGLQETPLALPNSCAAAQLLVGSAQPEARTALRTVIDNIRSAAAGPWMVADVASRCAEVALDLDDPDGAQLLTNTALGALRRLPDAGVVTARVEQLSVRVGSVPALAKLTTAEIEVLRQLASHRTLAQIGDHLAVSRATVKSHVASIYRKLGVTKRADAVERLVSAGPPPPPGRRPS